VAAIITQLMFTIDTGPTKWITTEFGIGLTIASVVMGIYFWRRRSALPAQSTALPRRLVVSTQ
jgi:hypothetical protein